MGSGFGYACRHELWMDDEIMVRYVPPPYSERSGSKVFFFEFRTKFVVEAGTGYRCDMGSEVFHRSCCSNDTSPLTETDVRLCDEYLMTKGEAQSLRLSAMDFAKKMETYHPRLEVIPVVVGIEVCTVQQAGEAFAATLERAIRPHCYAKLYSERMDKLLVDEKNEIESKKIMLKWQKRKLTDAFKEIEKKQCLERIVVEKTQIEDANIKVDAEIDKLLNQVSELEEYCKVQEEELKTQVGNYKSSIERALLERDVVQKRLENEKLRGLTKKKKIKHMRSYIGEVETKLAKTEADYAKTAGENKDLKIQSESLKMKIRFLEDQLADAKMEVRSLMTEQEQAKVESDELLNCQVEESGS